MRRLVIHFGMAKTGSTSIQTVLAGLAPHPEFHYLCVDGAANAGRTLTAAFASDPAALNVHRRLGLSEPALAEQRDQALDSFEAQLSGSASVFVLSTEMLSLIDEAGLCRLRDWFATRVDRVELFGYVRDPASFMESMFQQSLKASRSAFDAALRYPAYRERFERFERVFGADAVKYRAFEPASFPDRCVVRDFLQQCGVSLDPGPVPRSNESLTLDGVGLLYVIRRHGQPVGQGAAALRRNRRMVRMLREVPGSKFRLHRSLTEPIIDARHEDMQWISSRLDTPLQPRYPAESEPAIRSEADLFEVSEATRQWLREHLGIEVSPGRAGRQALARALQDKGFHWGQGASGDGAEPAPPVAAVPDSPPEPRATGSAKGGKVSADALVARVLARLPAGPLAPETVERIVAAGTLGLASRLSRLDGGLTVEGLGEFLHRRASGAGAGRGRPVFFRAEQASPEGDLE